MAIVFDGKAAAGLKKEDIKRKVAVLRAKGIIPKMVSVLGESNLESRLYVSMKAKFAQEVGIEFAIRQFEVIDKADKVVEQILKDNNDSSVGGIMVQLPIFEAFEVLEAIDPKKDVDCLTSENLGLLFKGKPRFLPATVKAVLEIIQSSKLNPSVSLREKVQSSNVCIVGASEIVGKPLAMALSDAGATVTLCRSTTKNIKEISQKADILISATGAPQLITQEMVKQGAIVIDVGISRLLREGRYKVIGDVDIGAACKASFITPVPGGVGPMTIACLFENLLDAIGV